MRRGLIAAVVALQACCLGSASAGADITLGVLTCTLAESGTPAGDAAVANQRRDALCTFKAKGGMEETYAGRFQGVNPSPGRNKALMWVVKGASPGTAQPGMLAQSYAADPAKPSDQKAPIIGEVHPDIQLYTMADEAEGSASLSEKPPPKGFVVIGVELTLTASAG
jgi:hypothetical protein